MYFYSDPSNGGVSINAGVTTSGSTVARGSIGAYLLDASETTAALGTINGNLLFTTENAQGVQTASFYGYIVGGTPNIMYVTQLVSGAINPGSDTVTYNGTAVSDIWDADYASSVSLTTFGSWASPQTVTGANGTYTAYAPGGTALYVKNVSSGGIYFGDSFTTPVPQTGTISGSNIGAIGGGGGDIGLSATLYTNSGTTPVNSFTNKKIQAVYDPVGSLITLGNGLLGYAGSMTVANNRGDDTGSYAGNCLFMKAGNPMFAENPVITGNASLLHAARLGRLDADHHAPHRQHQFGDVHGGDRLDPGLSHARARRVGDGRRQRRSSTSTAMARPAGRPTGRGRSSSRRASTAIRATAARRP